MDSLGETPWDVVLSGTSLPQSLLALALSRSGKKVLHVDRNGYYGGAEAALSLQEIDAWVEETNDATHPSLFRNAILQRSEQASDPTSGLGFSRAYSISLSPQLIYTRSNLLPALVSSKVHALLEFLAVGSWWIYSNSNHSGNRTGDSSEIKSVGELRRIPGGREDVFSDKSIDLRSSRSLMKFLKLAADAESHPSIIEAWGAKPFPEYLTSEFKIPEPLQAPLLALTSSPVTPSRTLTSFALPRIHRHLTSIGLFGPGFGAVLPKFGGLSEIAQIGCRAGAVGGGVYVLNNGLQTIEDNDQAIKLDTSKDEDSQKLPLKLRLGGDEEVKAHFVVSALLDLPAQFPLPTDTTLHQVSQSVAIVSSALSSLFYLAAEGAPPPAATVIVFPSGSLSLGDLLPPEDIPPVYLTVHSSETGECPAGQSIVYGHTSLSQPHASTLLTLATQNLLASLPASSNAIPSILWNLHYTRHYQVNDRSPDDNRQPSSGSMSHLSSNVINLPSVPPGLAVDDSVLKTVREAWAKIMGGDDGSFMLFEERSSVGEAEDENTEEEDLELPRSQDEDFGDGDEGGKLASRED